MALRAEHLIARIASGKASPLKLVSTFQPNEVRQHHPLFASPMVPLSAHQDRKPTIWPKKSRQKCGSDYPLGRS